MIGLAAAVLIAHAARVGSSFDDDRTQIIDIFFFSSRRRHTRSLRDWSSDVCSSDLANWKAGQEFRPPPGWQSRARSEEHTSELQSRRDLVCRLLLEKKKNKNKKKEKENKKKNNKKQKKKNKKK